MASCQTSQWTSTSPYVKLEVTQSSSTDTSATLSWTLYYIASSAASTSTARSYSVVINGSTVKSGTYSINGVAGTKTIASGTTSITKTYSSQTISFSCSFAFNLTWSGSYAGTKSASSSISVAAKTKYTVSYNANSGSGAPSSQTKWYGETLTLSSTKPTRNGYNFLGWSTSASATSATYSAGGSYTANAGATLYAVWKANTYTVTYNANGGTGAPSSQTKTYGVTLTLSTTKPTRTNYNFLGWSTSASATSATYSAGGSYTANAGATLYAVWSLAYTKPRITSVSVSRCDSTGTVIDEGTYALVKFTYACDQTISEVTIDWSSGDEIGSKTVSCSSSSGSVSEVVGDGTLNTENTYAITITVADTSGSNVSTKTLNSLKLLIDAMPQNKGIAFGKTANQEGFADFGYDIRLNADSNGNKLCIYGIKRTENDDGVIVEESREALNPINTHGNTILGYGNFVGMDGNTNIYGYDINFNVSNTAKGTDTDAFKPYRRKGDSATLTISTAGYVTASGTQVSFFIPFSVPIVGSPTVSVSCGNGFVIRQNNAYTHGSSATAYTTPSSMSASYYWCNGVTVNAVFSDTTNVVNNAPAGIVFNGTITFS